MCALNEVKGMDVFMNVIVSNKYAAMLSSLSTKIDLIKTVDGEFQVDDLIAQYQRAYFENGAIPAMPYKEEVYEFLKQQGL